MPTSFALGLHFEEFIQTQLKSGRYNNASEVIREGLRLLEDQECFRLSKLQALKGMIDEGLSANDPIPSDLVFSKVRSRLNEMGKGTDQKR